MQARRGPVRTWAARIFNASRRMRAGLSLGGERVWPGVRNDLFVAHQSLYRFFSEWTARATVLDAACGTGYGSALLMRNAQRVHGVDRDRSSIRYARRHFGSEGLTFAVADCEMLALPREAFDVVVCSNAMEHFEHPARFLGNVRAGLRADGLLALAIPPILDEHSLADNARNPYHVSNLSVGEWMSLFDREGWAVELYRHSFDRTGLKLDFASPFESLADEGDFGFAPCTYEELRRAGTITGLYLLRPRTEVEAAPRPHRDIARGVALRTAVGAG